MRGFVDKNTGFLRCRGSVVMDIDYRTWLLCISELKYLSYFGILKHVIVILICVSMKQSIQNRT